MKRFTPDGQMEGNKFTEEEIQKLLEGARAAYWHLDTYGFPNHPDSRLMESQKRVFDLLREFCPPIPGRL